MKVLIVCCTKYYSAPLKNNCCYGCKCTACRTIQSHLFITVLNQISFLWLFFFSNGILNWTNHVAGITLYTSIFIDNRIQKSFFIWFHLYTFLWTNLCTGRTTSTIFFILNFNHLISFPHNTDSEIKTNSKLSTYALA